MFTNYPPLNFAACVCAALVFVTAVYTAEANTIEKIVVATEEWEDNTNADGTGSFFDIIREVYANEGIEMEFQIVPYERSVELTRKKAVDAWVAAYHEEEDFALFPKWHFDADIVTAVYRRNRFPTFDGVDSLTGLTVSWIRGYAYDEYIDSPMKVHKLSSRNSAVRMLARDRIDVFLDASVEINGMIDDVAENESWGFYKDDFEFQTLLQLNLYLAFSDTERSRELISIWDRNFEKLLKSGGVKAIFERHGVENFPFRIGG